MKKLTVCLGALLVCSALLYGCGNSAEPDSTGDTPAVVTGDQAKIEYNKSISPDSINLIQLDSAQNGEASATIETTVGSLELRLFKEQAPLAVEQFVTLAEQGHYSGLPVSDIISGERVTIGQEKPADVSFADEYSMDLWHFYGAVAMDNSGKADQNNGAFYIVQNSSLHKDILEEMEEVGFPEKVVTAYGEMGGAPSCDQRDTVFGQITNGLDVLEAIAAGSTEEPVKIVGITIS